MDSTVTSSKASTEAAGERQLAAAQRPLAPYGADHLHMPRGVQRSTAASATLLARSWEALLPAAPARLFAE